MHARSLAAAFVSVALLAAACGNPLDSLATIDGEPVDLGDVTALRVSYDETVDATTGQFRGDLTFVIRHEVLVRAADDQFGIAFTEEDVTAWLAAVPPRYADGVANLRAIEDVAEGGVRTQAEEWMVRDAVTAELATAEGFFATTLAESPQLFTSACVRHILVPTAAEAEDAIARVEGGEAFADVAREVSTDGSAAAGGLLGAEGNCVRSLTDFIGPFATAAATAEIGVATGPVETQFGFHAILVEERVGPPTLAAVEADPIPYLDAAFPVLYDPWAGARLDVADVEVEPLVGVWTPGAGVGPPDG